MKKNPTSKSGFSNLRAILAVLFSSLGVALGMFGLIGAASSNTSITTVATPLDSAPATPAYMDAMPSFVRQPIEATLQWMASFGTPSAPQHSVMRRSAANPGTTGGGTSVLTPVVGEAVNATVSPAVRDLPPASAFSAWTQPREEGQLPNRTRQGPPDPLEHDPVIQSTTAPTVRMPAVGASFEGISIAQACEQCLPPDTNGAVGPNHYVQMVNSSFQVYDKASGAALLPTHPCAITTTNQCAPYINSLWMLTPNSECFQHNNGDPIVIYDQLADRWLISQFVTTATAPTVTYYAQCIAISTSPDPTGTYYLYEFDESTDTFHDYPHIGVWPDGYYMSTNLFPNSALLFSTGAGAWAFERPKMLLGQPAKFVYFDETGLSTNCVPMGTCAYRPGGQLPSSLEGKNLPPAGAPNYFVEVDDTNTPNTPPATGLHDEMHIWKFHVDWTNPASSSFGIGSSAPALKPGFPGQYAANAGQPDFIIPIADFLRSACQIENGPNDCSPQPVTSGQPPQSLDVLGDRLMHRLTYRNFGDHESLLLSHTVDAQADQPMGVARNGPRWYELRTVSTTPTVYQQGTFAPFDPTSTNGPLWRWMGSAAMDHSGDIAIGYTASGPNYFPSLHYAGRLAGDLPLGELTQGEAVMFVGAGIEANTGIFPFRNRWGDYSALQVDPADDCTFWYTNEYLISAATDILPVNWHTRIGSFRFPQCVPAPARVVSRKFHETTPTATNFDIDLLPPFPAIEMRRNTGADTTGSNVGHDHQVVFTFGSGVTITAVGGCTASGGATCTVGSFSGALVTADLHNVADVQTLSITLTNVRAGGGPSDVGPVLMKVLAGDTNEDSRTNVGDTNQTKSRSGQLTDSTNFKSDVNLDGRINVGDTNFVKANSGHSLP